ncbi:MAG: hypothetical protein S4CHLAM102_07510 [Chlamydiia bacterium]|nr:hypothetical protein [Chlamydiia bacterium]
MQITRLIFVFCCTLISLKGSLFATPMQLYPLNRNPMDVVIPCAKKDVVTLDHCIEGIRKNGINIRRIIVVSKEKLTDKAEWFSESNFPFQMNDLAYLLFPNSQAKAEQYIHHPKNRLGWLFQQLIKFYAAYVIPDISDNILLLDADTIFLKPVLFQDKNGYPLFNPGEENHLPYFEHGKRFIPGFQKMFPHISGITHHMLFQRPVLDDLFTTVETAHHCLFFEAFCKCIETRYLFHSAASEYELYFNFFLSRSNQYHIRALEWKNPGFIEELEVYRSQRYDYVSCHSYARGK